MKCIICRIEEVIWPLVCDDCTDREAQDELLAEYGGESPGWECRTCGMLYDGGARCTYCGDDNPLDDSD